MNKHTIDQDLIDALLHFAAIRIPSAPIGNTATIYTVRSADGTRRAWTVEQVCAAAFEALYGEELAALKLHHLQRRMREFGLQDMYQHLMGEPLP